MVVVGKKVDEDEETIFRVVRGSIEDDAFVSVSVSVVVNVTFVPDDEGLVVPAKVVETLLLEISVVGGFVFAVASLLLESGVNASVVVAASLLLESVVGASVVIKLQDGRMCVVVIGSVKVNLLLELLSLFNIADEEISSELEELGLSLTLQ